MPASPTYWVVTTSVFPVAATSRNCFQILSRRIGSMPAVGSSRNTMSGSWTNAAARASRRCMPPDASATRLPASSVSSTQSSTEQSRCLRRNGNPYMEAWKLRFSISDRSGNNAGVWGR